MNAANGSWQSSRSKVIRLLSVVLEQGVSILGRLNCEDAPLGIKHNLDLVPGPYPESPSEPSRDSCPEANTILPTLIREYIGLVSRWSRVGIPPAAPPNPLPALAYYGVLRRGEACTVAGGLTSVFVV